MSKLTASDPQRPAADIADRRAIAYTLGAEDVFASLRALIGQVSGMLILAQARLYPEMSDRPELAAAGERLQEAVARLAGLDPPAGQAAGRRRLEQAARHIDGALTGILHVRSARTDDCVGAAAAELQAAYRLMQSVCDHRTGLTMVDMGGACCNCGQILQRHSEKPGFGGTAT